MFDQTFVDGTQETRKPYAVFVSTVLQMVALSVGILVPLVSTQQLPNAVLRSMLMAPSPPVVTPKPPTSPTRSQLTATTRTLQLTKVFVPTVIPKQIAPTDIAAPAMDIGVAGNAAAQAEAGNALLFGSNVAPAQPAPPLPLPVKLKSPSAVRVGGVVAGANLIHRVQPVYPPLARSARVQGSVEFSAIITRSGTVRQLQLLRGHPLLVNAAREAILQWRYRPTLLNREPVDVITTITVNFVLGQ